jgi:acetyl esterase
MPLHPDAATYLASAPARPPLDVLGAAGAREWRRRQALLAHDIAVPVGRVVDETIEGPAGAIPLRLYQPTTPPPYPVIVYCHGGGWVTGDRDQVDVLCRLLCQATGALVASVEYHLAPEYPYPAPVDDAYQALVWAQAEARAYGGDPTRLASAGDSSGATLALAAALRALDQGTPRLSALVLAHPPGRPQFDMPSYQAYESGYGLTRADMMWYWAQYLSRPEDRADPYAAPLERKHFRGLPPTILVAAEYDVLRSDVEELEARLRADGVPVRGLYMPGMIHGFFTAAWGASARQQAVNWVADALAAVWSPSGSHPCP